jgi:hypothetical protein
MLGGTLHANVILFLSLILDRFSAISVSPLISNQCASNVLFASQVAPSRGGGAKGLDRAMARPSIFLFFFTTRKLSLCDISIATFEDNCRSVLYFMKFATVYATV